MMKIKPIMTAACAAALVLGAAACGAPTPVSKADMLGTTASDTTETAPCGGLCDHRKRAPNRL